MLKHPDPHPWRDGNRCRLLVDGGSFFPAMLQAIAHARHSVHLELYLFESGRLADRFIDALSAAAGRGCAVRLLLDDFGCAKLNEKDRQRLREGGVELAFYNPLHYGALRRSLFRDHRKLLLVDGRLAFTGGAGITDEFDDTPQRPGWHETMVEIRGPVLRDWQRLFANNWRLWSGRSLESSSYRPRPLVGGLPGRVVVNAPTTQMAVIRSLIRQLRTARQRAWISTAYFLPSWKLRRELRRAVRRGVDVRLLLPGPITDHTLIRQAGRRFYARLLRAGVRIYEYQPRFLHAKVWLCDDWTSVGSTNIDRWNLRWNLEANQECRGGPMIGEVERFFVDGFEQSLEIGIDDWRARSRLRRFMEWWTGKVDTWVDRLSQRLGRK